MDIDMNSFMIGILLGYFLGMFVEGKIIPKLAKLYDKYIGDDKK